MARIIYEACVGSVDAAIHAEAQGADRVELCDRLDVGGTTPSPQTVERATATLHIPVFVIVRPRGGDFVYDPGELALMQRDALIARAAGAAGLVVGILRPNDTIDVERMRDFMAAVPGLPVTFHLAFERVPRQDQALDQLIELGVSRLLTSGGAPTALEGVPVISRLVARAAGRLVVMAGGSVRAHNAAEIVRRSGVPEIHSRGTDVRGIIEAASRGLAQRDPGERPADPSDGRSSLPIIARSGET